MILGYGSRAPWKRVPSGLGELVSAEKCEGSFGGIRGSARSAAAAYLLVLGVVVTGGCFITPLGELGLGAGTGSGAHYFCL